LRGANCEFAGDMEACLSDEYRSSGNDKEDGPKPFGRDKITSVQHKRKDGSGFEKLELNEAVTPHGATRRKVMAQIDERSDREQEAEDRCNPKTDTEATVTYKWPDNVVLLFDRDTPERTGDSRNKPV
jgi:hypothetical protein